MSAQLEPAWYCRSLRRRDLAQVLEIEDQAYDFPWSEGIFLDCIRMGYSNCVAVDQRNQVLGYCLMSYTVEEAHLLNLCTAESHRRMGLGRFILRYQLQQARMDGVKKILLEVRPSNPAATRLYANEGFVQIGTRKGYYPAFNGREDAWVLCLQL